MACLYYLNGNRNHPMTEVQLDDFLTEKGEFISDYGDLVFDFSVPSLGALSILDKQVYTDGKNMREIYNKNKAEYKEMHVEDEKCEFFKPPYYGVNHYLAHVLTETHEGLRLFPEFIPEKFWPKRRDSWLKGEFSDVEKEVFFDNEQTKLDAWIAKGWDPNSEVGIKELDRMQKAVEYKWKQLADTGTEIHKVLLLYFQDPDRVDLYEHILKNVDSNKVDDKLVGQLLEYAKTMKQQLDIKFGKDGQLKYYTEMDITLKLDEKIKGLDANLLGVIDLLVVDGKGNLHVIDYKTSIKPYDQFDDSKKAAFTYLLATYQRMLERYQLSTRCDGAAMIAPIEMTNFRKSGTWVDPDDGLEHDRWVYDGVKAFPNMFVDLTDKTKNPYISDKLDEFMVSKQWIQLTSDQLQEYVSKMIKKWFPNYGDKVYSDEEIREIITENKGFEVNDAGNMVFHIDKSNIKDIVVEVKNGDRVKAEEEMFNKVAKYFRSWPEKRANLTQSVLNSLVKAMENPELDVEFKHGNVLDDPTGGLQWFKDVFARYYTNGASYKLLNGDPRFAQSLTNNGIIAMLNLRNQQIDFIKISTLNLFGKYRFRDSKGNELKDHNSLIGRESNDLKEQRKTDSLITMATYGNIELMEMMLAINNMAASFKLGDDASVGRVLVANPMFNRGISMSNEELVYNYSALNDMDEIINDNLLQEGSTVKFSSRWKLLMNQLTDIFNPNGISSKNEKYRMLESCKNALELTSETQMQERIAALEDFINKMQDKEVNFGMNSSQERQNDMEVMLYNNAVLALAELKGIKFRQQIERYGNWFQSARVWEKGFNSLKFDNPGHMNNETLNLMAKLTFEWYLKVRDDLTNMKPTLDLHVNALKNNKGFNKLLEYTVGNQASMYSRMIYRGADGDLLLVNPYEDLFTLPDGSIIVLSNVEKDFLKYFLREINLDRQGANNESLFQLQIDNNDKVYFQLPLVKGTLASRAAAKNKNFIQDLSTGVLNYLKFLNPKYTWREVKKGLHKVAEALSDDNTQQTLSDDEFFKMTNEFDKGMGVNRLDYIKHPLGGESTEGDEYFERNLETLLLRHKCAYATKKYVNEGVPMMKAALIHLTNMGTDQNRQFADEIKYIRDFFKNKVKGESLVDPKFEVVNQGLSKLRSVASLMTLGVAPVQFFYQLLDGMWKDISLIIRKPDGTEAFTFANMTAAAKDAFSDMFTAGKPTVSSLLNQLYGLNDMDMNVYFDRIKSDQWGLYNWRTLAFYSASRPDFYNRLTIFGSLMRADGTWEAHSIENGKLKYDFKKDKRFNLLSDPSKKGTPEYQLQLGRYYAVAKEFVKEGAKYADGTLFSISSDPNHINALPRAYTTKEAESMKSLCDNLYGFYSHERKSMILAETLGALWMLYRTYWSGKKNQFLQHGGIKLQGQWVLATNTQGERMYDIVDQETGMVKSVAESQLGENDPRNPTFVWKGQWEEGIALTLTRLMNEVSAEGNFITAWNKLRLDDDFGQAYRANLDLLLYDVSMFAIIGSAVNLATGEWLKELKKEKKDSTDFIDALELAGANVVARSLNNSFLDFNFFDSIGSPGVSWNPFAFTWATNEVGNIYNFATGDKTFIQMLESGSGSMKLVKPIWDWVDVQLIHNGDKTSMPAWRKTHKKDN